MADALRAHLAIVADAKDHLTDVPPSLRGELARYLDLGEEPTTTLLRCVIENDLEGALAFCTEPHLLLKLRPLTFFLWNHAPALCRGSRERRLAWQEKVAALHAPPPEVPDLEVAGA